MFRFLLVMPLLGGCAHHAYDVTPIAGEGRYVIVDDRSDTGMRVYDCTSTVASEYAPTCTRVKFQEKVEK